MVYLNIDSEYFEKNKDKFLKTAKEEFGDENSKSYLYIDEIEGQISEIEDNKIFITIENSPIGYISMDVSISTDDLVKLLEIAVKKMNKYKTVLESLK